MDNKNKFAEEAVKLMSLVVDRAAESGILAFMPNASNKEELKHAVKTDILLYLVRLTEPDKKIGPAGVAFLNTHLGYELNMGSLDIIKKHALKQMEEPISTLLPFFLKVDADADGPQLSVAYVKALCYIAIAFLVTKRDTSFQELVTYYRYANINFRIIGCILDVEEEFDPLISIGYKDGEEVLEAVQNAIEEDGFDDDRYVDSFAVAFEQLMAQMDEDYTEAESDENDSPEDQLDTDEEPADDDEESADDEELVDDEDSADDEESVDDAADLSSRFRTSNPASRDQSRKPNDQSLFREYYHKYVLVYQNPASCGLDKLGFGINPGDNCMLAYGYVDHTAGLSLHILCSACETKQGLLKLGGMSDGSTMTMRYNSENGNIRSLGSLIPNEAFFNKIRMVNEGYKGSADLEILREYEDIDLLRHPQFPDDMRVKFIKPGLQGEEIWCRMESISDNLIMGTLLNEPYGDFGIHEGDSVGILTGNVDGQMMAVAKL